MGLGLVAATFFWGVPPLVACWRPRFAARLSVVGLVPYVFTCLLFWFDSVGFGARWLAFTPYAAVTTVPSVFLLWLGIWRPPAVERQRARVLAVLVTAVPLVYLLGLAPFLSYVFHVHFNEHG